MPEKNLKIFTISVATAHKVWEIIKEKKHLTKEGLDLIIKLKGRMNTKRIISAAKREE